MTRDYEVSVALIRDDKPRAVAYVYILFDDNDEYSENESAEVAYIVQNGWTRLDFEDGAFSNSLDEDIEYLPTDTHQVFNVSLIPDFGG